MQKERGAEGTKKHRNRIINSLIKQEKNRLWFKNFTKMENDYAIKII